MASRPRVAEKHAVLSRLSRDGPQSRYCRPGPRVTLRRRSVVSLDTSIRKLESRLGTGDAPVRNAPMPADSLGRTLRAYVLLLAASSTGCDVHDYTPSPEGLTHPQSLSSKLIFAGHEVMGVYANSDSFAQVFSYRTEASDSVFWAAIHAALPVKEGWRCVDTGANPRSFRWAGTNQASAMIVRVCLDPVSQRVSVMIVDDKNTRPTARAGRHFDALPSLGSAAEKRRPELLSR